MTTWAGDMIQRQWVSWVAPAVLMGLCSIAFTVGVYVGESRSEVKITRLEQQLIAHVEIPRHSGAISADTLLVQFQSINQRLDRLETMLERLDGER